jgi:hypothetical protein
VVYERASEAAGLLSLWTLQPWAWAAQGAALWTMIGLAAVACAVPRRGPARTLGAAT